MDKKNTLLHTDTVFFPRKSSLTTTEVDTQFSIA